METPVIYTETFQEEEEEEEDSTDDEIDWLVEYIYDDDDDDDFTEDSSEEPEYRPPYAGGNNSSSSSDEDSELECPPIHFQVEESDCDESLDWADHEDNITTIVKQTPTTPPIENKFIASGSCATPVNFFSGYQRCVGCKYWFKQTTLYCNSCWKMKKDWLPDPPPPKSKLSRSKIKTARQKRTKQRGNRSDDTLSRSSSSSNETEDPISAPRITLCMLCCTNPRNASLIHGQIGHQLCCYPCAKKLWKEQARCPVCRRKIEKVVKLIQN